MRVYTAICLLYLIIMTFMLMMVAREARIEELIDPSSIGTLSIVVAIMVICVIGICKFEGFFIGLTIAAISFAIIAAPATIRYFKAKSTR